MTGFVAARWPIRGALSPRQRVLSKSHPNRFPLPAAIYAYSTYNVHTSQSKIDSISEVPSLQPAPTASACPRASSRRSYLRPAIGAGPYGLRHVALMALSQIAVAAYAFRVLFQKR